jgi:hypothetical protein
VAVEAAFHLDDLLVLDDVGELDELGGLFGAIAVKAKTTFENLPPSARREEKRGEEKRGEERRREERRREERREEERRGGETREDFRQHQGPMGREREGCGVALSMNS